jgi:hypothetical protein
VGAIIAVLKVIRMILLSILANFFVSFLLLIFVIFEIQAILVLGDADKSSHGKSSSNHHDDDDFKWGGSARMENASLSDFAKHTLAQICLQDWVHERCLQVIMLSFISLLCGDNKMSLDSWWFIEKGYTVGSHVNSKTSSKTVAFGVH